MIVSRQRAGKKMGLTQNLEPVADTEHGHAAMCSVDDGAHHRREASDRTTPQVVPIGEATWKNNRVDVLHVVITVP